MAILLNPVKLTPVGAQDGPINADLVRAEGTFIDDLVVNSCKIHPETETMAENEYKHNLSKTFDWTLYKELCVCGMNNS